jgi:N,N'-diacetylbacillosaminyl-diphospho-undecaprenol alpha-1,3-N-acetylgalactosaminyltransferase
MIKAIHSIHSPKSARVFVMPLVDFLNKNGIQTELWVENTPNQAKAIEQLNVPKKLISIDLSLNPYVFFDRLSKFRNQLAVTKPKILHAHQSRASLIPLLAAYIEKVPVRIYHNHGLPYLGYQGILRSLLKLLEILNIRLATHVLLVSNSNLAEAEADGLLPKNKGSVIANGSAVGIDINEFDCSEDFIKKAKGKFNVAEANFVLAYVGRPVKRKGFHLLLKAWEKSGLGLQNNYLLIAGCTHAECETVLGHSVSGVRGIGYLEDLREFYAACDALTLPSQHEGFGCCLLEAAAAGKPLIGTDISGIRCAIKHNETGLLVPCNDDDALINAIVKLASDPALRLRLGQNARKRADQEFSKEVVLADLLDFYQNLGIKVD